MKTFTQQTNYTCGPAAVKTFLSNYFDKLPPEDKLKDSLEVSKDFGTTPHEIISYLVSLGFVLRSKEIPFIKNIGLCLVNVNTYSHEFPEDGQNGHWLYFEKVNDTFIIFDPYTSESKKINFEDFKKFTKNIKIKSTVYNDVFLFCKK